MSNKKTRGGQFLFTSGYHATKRVFKLFKHIKGEAMVSKRCQSIVMITVIFFSIVAIADGITLVDAADKSGRFTGTWVANGTRDVLPFGEKRETAFLKLSGHVNLKDQVGMHWVGRLRVRQ